MSIIKLFPQTNLIFNVNFIEKLKFITLQEVSKKPFMALENIKENQ